MIAVKAHSKAQYEFSDFMQRLCGQDYLRCFQCGTCSGVCPMLGHMDVSPRQVMHMIHLGLTDELASSKAWWACSTCQGCLVSCPRGIDIPRVLEALRQFSLRQGRDHVAPSQETVEQLPGYPQIALIAAFRKFTA